MMHFSFLSGFICGLFISYFLVIGFNEKVIKDLYPILIESQSVNVVESPDISSRLSNPGSSKKKLISYNIILKPPGVILQTIKDTWANEVNHIHYYMTPGSKSDSSSFLNPSIVILDNEMGYPLLATLKLICEREGAEFEWFAMLSGYTYLKVTPFEKLLKSITSSRPLMLGNLEISKQENGPLNVYCSEMGVVMNHLMIERVCPKLLYCDKTVLLSSEVEEFSKCIRNITNIACAKISELRQIFYHARGKAATDDLQVGVHELNTKLVKPLLFYPLTHSDHFYNFHLYVLKKEFDMTFTEYQSLLNYYDHLSDLFKSFHISSSSSQLIQDHGSFINLSLINSSMIYSKSRFFPKLMLESYPLLDLKTSHKCTSNSRHVAADFEHGIYDFITTEFKTKIDVTTKRMSLLPWKAVSIRKAIHLTDKVNFIVAVPSVSQSFQRFMLTFEMSFLSRNSAHKVSLFVVLFSNSHISVTRKSVFAVATLVEMYQRKYPHTDLRIKSTEDTASWKQLLHLATEEYSPYEILFIANTHMDFSPQFLHHCLSNAVEGQQVYFPSIFTPFDPVKYQQSRLLYPYATKLRTTSKDGTWLPPAPNTACIYTSDLKSILQNLRFQKDINLLQAALSMGFLRIFSSPDPGLVHLWREGCSEEMTSAVRGFCDIFSNSHLCECTRD